MWAHPGKQLLFMGAELGQEAEWAESRNLDWWLEETPWHAGLQQLVRDLNALYRAHPQLWSLDSEPAGFEWIDANDAPHNTFSFIRKDAAGQPLVCVANFAGIPDEDYRIGLPQAGRWREILNTDAEGYGGSGVGNLGGVQAEELPWHGRPASVVLRVPPLGAVWLVPEDDENPDVPTVSSQETNGTPARGIPAAGSGARPGSGATTIPTTPPTPAHGLGITAPHQDAEPPEWVKELAKHARNERSSNEHSRNEHGRNEHGRNEHSRNEPPADPR
jgi:hypothetical protein